MMLRKNKNGEAAVATLDNASTYDVILRPMITEKSTLASEQNKMSFEVARGANKHDIKASVEALFKVNVLSVNTQNRKGKTKGFRGKKGQQSDRKFATVTIKEGQTIDIAAGVK